MKKQEEEEEQDGEVSPGYFAFSALSTRFVPLGANAALAKPRGQASRNSLQRGQVINRNLESSPAVALSPFLYISSYLTSPFTLWDSDIR